MPSLNDYARLLEQAEKKETKNKKFMENLMSWKKPKPQKTPKDEPAKKGWGKKDKEKQDA